MQTKTNRRGLAIGAAIALLGTFFGAAPASYASTDGQYIDIRPLSNSDLTNFTGLLSEDFPVYAELKSGTANANSNFANDKLIWIVERVSGGLDVLAASTTVSAIAPGSFGSFGLNNGLSGTQPDRLSTSEELSSYSFGVYGATVSSFVTVWSASASATLAARVNAAGQSMLFIRGSSVSGITSSSPNLTVKVTVFIDDLGGQNGKYDSGEWFTSKTITLTATSRLAPTVTFGTPARGDTVVTASATLAALNWSNLNGKPFIQVESSDTTARFTGNDNTSASPAISAAQATARAGVVSFSFAVTSLTESTTISGGLKYVIDGTGTVSEGVLLGASSTSVVVSAPGVTTLSISGTVAADMIGGGNEYDLRPNKTYTFTVLASSGSSNASVSSTITVNITGSAALSTASNRALSINGGSFLTTYPAAGFSVTTGTNGRGTFTITTVGFKDSETLGFTATRGNISSPTLVATVEDPEYTVVADYSNYATAPGTSVNIGFSVEDQYGELSTKTNHFLQVSRNTVTGFNYAATVSYHAVTAGLATVAYLPQPATATGSVTLTVDIMKLENGAYFDEGTAATVKVEVTSATNAFRTGLAASYAASVSYFANTVSWVTVTGKVLVTGSAVVVTGDSTLVFRKSATLTTTTSGTITVATNDSAEYSFQVAGLRSGSKTMTLTNGTATTTSLLVVSAAASDLGRTLTWDTTAIDAGKTRVVTGTLTDANGNPVDTTGNGSTTGDAGTASILVTFTGTAGVVVGTVPTETDADGKFRISVLTSATDNGTLTLTAVYNPQGSTTVAANKITSVQAITVAPAAAPEVNAVIGSFNGRWAVRVENAKGSVVSVKAGNRWVKFSALNNNYLFSRKSVVGRTIAVSVWVDGELQNSQTITIK